MFNQLPLTYEVIDLSDAILRGLASDGTMYFAQASSQNQLLSSPDGSSFTTLFQAAGPIEHVRELPNDDLIIFTRGGGVYLSDDRGQTATQTTQLTGNMSAWGGVDVYANFVLAAPYAGSHERIVYLSSDYGATWKEIFNGEDADFDHIHDVRFDPYENLIWVVTGDHRPKDSIFYSDDLGQTWFRVDGYYRCTNIMPLPDSVWFGTDEQYVMGAYRHVRPLLGTTQTRIKPELVWAARKDSRDSAPVIWATKPAMVYGNRDTAAAYWGYRQGDAPVIPASIYATRGERVYPMVALDKIPEAKGGTGIESVWGPDSNGNLVADLRYHDGSNMTFHVLKVTLPA